TRRSSDLADAEVCALPPTMLLSEEETTFALRGPKTSVNEFTELTNAARELLIVPRSAAWLCNSVCCCCQTESCPFFWFRTSLTIELTSIPLPESKLAALKLIPMAWASLFYGFIRFARALLREAFLQFCLDFVDDAQHLRAG